MINEIKRISSMILILLSIWILWITWSAYLKNLEDYTTDFLMFWATCSSVIAYVLIKSSKWLCSEFIESNEKWKTR